MHGFESLSKKELHALIKEYNLHHSITNYTKLKVKELRELLGKKYFIRNGHIHVRPLTVDDFDWGSDEEEPPRPPPKPVAVARKRALEEEVEETSPFANEALWKPGPLPPKREIAATKGLQRVLDAERAIKGRLWLDAQRKLGQRIRGHK